MARCACDQWPVNERSIEKVQTPLIKQSAGRLDAIWTPFGRHLVFQTSFREAVRVPFRRRLDSVRIPFRCCSDSARTSFGLKFRSNLVQTPFERHSNAIRTAFEADRPADRNQIMFVRRGRSIDSSVLVRSSSDSFEKF